MAYIKVADPKALAAMPDPLLCGTWRQSAIGDEMRDWIRIGRCIDFKTGEVMMDSYCWEQVLKCTARLHYGGRWEHEARMRIRHLRERAIPF